MKSMEKLERNKFVYEEQNSAEKKSDAFLT